MAEGTILRICAWCGRKVKDLSQDAVGDPIKNWANIKDALTTCCTKCRKEGRTK